MIKKSTLQKWVRSLIREDLTGYQASNYPYRIGRAPGFGYGTGTGGNSNTKPHRGSLGGNPHGYYPRGKPHADVFTGALQDEREVEWGAARARFADDIASLKRDLTMATSDRDINAALDRIVKDDTSLVDEIVPDPGAYHTALKRGDITLARSMLIQGLDGWAGRIMSKYERAGQDAGGLDQWSYDTTPAESLGRGSGRWS